MCFADAQCFRKYLEQESRRIEKKCGRLLGVLVFKVNFKMYVKPVRCEWIKGPSVAAFLFK